MKFKALLAAFLAMPLALAAQTTNSTTSVMQPSQSPGNIAGVLYASNFAHWTVSPTAEGLRWSDPAQCYGTSGGITFPLFSKTAPITIVDLATSANTETVTPTFVSYTVGGCSVALPAAHAHVNYYLKSGTAGLQEAANWAGSGYYQIQLTPDWTTLGGTLAIATAATLGANTTILDLRSVQTFYAAPSGSCAPNGAVGINLAATSTSTVLYVCYTTWGALSQP